LSGEADLSLPFILLAFLYFSVIFFGGAHLWAQSILLLGIFGTGLCFLWRGWLTGTLTGRDLLLFFRDPVSLAGLGFLLWVVFSLVPLPAGFLRFLSPGAWRIWEAASLAGAKFPHPFSLYPYITLNSLTFGAALFIFYQMARLGLPSRSSMEILVIGLLILGTLESLYAMVLLAGGHPYTLWWERTVGQGMATGSFIDRNHLAGFLSMLICLGIGYLWALVQARPEPVKRKRPNRVERLEGHLRALGNRGILVLAAVALMLTALLSTASRGGALSLLAGMLFMTGMIGARYLKNRKALVLLLALIVTCGYVGTLALDRVLARFQNFAEGFEERLALARATWRMAADFPLTGTGLGTFEFAFPAYQDSLAEVLIDYAHNDWVQLLAETGWVGLALVGGGLVWLLGSGAARWFKGRDPFSLGIGLGTLGALLAIAVHELTEFNLHIPANALLLSLIVALLYPTIFLREDVEKQTAGLRETKSRSTRWPALPVVLLITAAAGIAAWHTLQVWRADSLARTVWNSTIPFRNPSNADLQKAWSLTPGNAAYWLWMASRNQTEGIGQGPWGDYSGKGFKDGKIHLLAEGIRRNPTSWVLWRELGWAAAFSINRDPDRYLSLAQKAMDRARRLRPFSSQADFDCGLIGLSITSRFGVDRLLLDWKEDFRRALRKDPSLAPKAADQLVLYLGAPGAREVSSLLPDNSRGQLSSAQYLLKQGYFPEGLACLRKGEGFRRKETEALWVKYLQGRGNSSEEQVKVLEQLLEEDPAHPGALLSRGKVLEAFKAQEQRQGDLQSLAPLQSLKRTLEEWVVPDQGRSWEKDYFLGRIAAEEGDGPQAEQAFKKALGKNSLYFPAWIHLKNRLTKDGKGSEERETLMSLEQNIQRYAMEGIVPDAWKEDKPSEGFSTWAAPFRVADPKGKVRFQYAGEPPKAWKLLLDGRFLLAGDGQADRGEIKTLLTPGEHVLKIVDYEHGKMEGDRRIPFSLAVWFRDE
jgi:O-antigen ligase/tetratricopeptide (TPR) repeat protein